MAQPLDASGVSIVTMTLPDGTTFQVTETEKEK